MRSPAQERQRQKKAMQRELERRAQLLPNAAHLVGIVPPSQDVQQLRWLQVQCAFRAMFVDELCRNLLAVPELGLLCVATESDAEPRIVEIDVPDIEPDDSAELEPPSPATSRRPTPAPIQYDAWESVLAQVQPSHLLHTLAMVACVSKDAQLAAVDLMKATLVTLSAPPAGRSRVCQNLVRSITPIPFQPSRSIHPVPTIPFQPSRSIHPVPSIPFQPSRSIHPLSGACLSGG